jgi:predicted nicotinamide N-methyase
MSPINCTISLAIPEGAEHGDTLTFIHQGEEIEIEVPFGSNVGDVLQIKVASTDHLEDIRGDICIDNHNNTCEKLITRFDLGNGKSLNLTSKLPNDMLQEEDTKTSEDAENDGTFTLPWRSGLELARQWENIPLNTLPRRVLELGSGLGLVGFSFAGKLQQKLAENATVVLTDLPAALPLLQHNLERNQYLFPPKFLKVKDLRWTIEDEKDIGPSEPPYDCILGSDLLYNEIYIPDLVATTKRLLHPTKGIFVLAVRWRKPDIERDFFRETGLTWELVGDHATCQLDWKDFGNPSNKESNAYFHKTQISVQGKPKSLADITEEEVEKLLSDEFEAWDQAHIQIFIGRTNSET